MASAAVGAAAAGGAFASVPYVGWILGIAAAYIDATYVQPEFAGKGRAAAKPPRMLDVPVGSNEPGAPRIWAIGSRVRLPTHILWQDKKARESQSGGSKGGTVPIRRVYIDAMVSLNDRKTESLINLIGNGKLLLYKSRNIIVISTSAMTATYDAAGPTVKLEMASTSDPSFTDKFEAGDLARCSGFVHVAGATTLNNTYWNVDSVTEHSPGAPSTMHLTPLDGQVISGMSYTGGNPFSPASVEVVLDAVVEPNVLILSTISLPGVGHWLQLKKTGPWPDGVFTMGTHLRLRNLTPTLDPSTTWRIESYNSVSSTAPTIYTISLSHQSGPLPGGVVVYSPISALHGVVLEYAEPPLFTAGVFPSDYDPQFWYRAGTETVGEDQRLVAIKGTGNVPAYRGVAYQTMVSFYATQFGDQLPYSLEALIQPDIALTWQEAVTLVLERAGLQTSSIDVSMLTVKPFAGMFLRGNVPTITAMQPMLVAGQIVGQERDGIITLFGVDDADVVQVENGAGYSDFGALTDGESRIDNKVVIEDQAEEDLPTSIGIRHQDPDNQFADGYQHFGLRNPGGVSHQNAQEIDLSNMVLTRKEARNLATTMMRRAWINRRKYRFMLPAAYLDLLENDICTFTADGGDVVRCRVIQRDIGADFRVAVTAISEDVNLEVSGSPVQTGAGAAVPIVIPPAHLRVIPIDAPGIRNSEVDVPGIKLAICADGGGENWGGAIVYESINGASYQVVGSVANQAAIGQFDTDLTAQTASEVYGTTTVTLRAQTVDVTFAYEGDTPLEAATQAEAEAGKNWVAIFGTSSVEIAAFTTVTPLGNRQYTLGGWLRGLRGTAPQLQYTGSQLVMLHPLQDNVFFRQFPGSTVPSTLAYKVVPLGAGIDDVDPINITSAGLNAKPLPVRSVTKTIGASPFDARFTVDAHWSRQVLPLGTQPPHAMDEPVEAYRFDIYDPAVSAIVRTKTITAQDSGSGKLRDKWVTYTDTEQIADGYTPSALETFWVDVVQIGEFGDSPSILEEI